MYMLHVQDKDRRNTEQFSRQLVKKGPKLSIIILHTKIVDITQQLKYFLCEASLNRLNIFNQY